MYSYKQYLYEVFSQKQKTLLVTKFGTGSEKYIDTFDKLRTNNRKEVKGIDISSFKSLEALKDFLATIGDSKTKETKELKHSGVDKVFENELVNVYHIKTREASCLYGANTKWCVSSKDTDQHWNEYTDEDITFYFIIKKTPMGNNYDKLAINVYPSRFTKENLEGYYEIEDHTTIGKNVVQMWDVQDKNISDELDDVLKELKVPKSVFKQIEDGSPFVIVDNKKFKYTLEGDVRIYREIDISDMNLSSIPDFGDNYIVTGNFSCSFNNLTTLEGAPKEVGKHFKCTGNNLTTLEGAPKEVGEYFYCSHNKLTTLEGAPKQVGGYFYCSHNKLTSLVGAPKEVGRHFYCNNNKLTTLEGAPKEVGDNFSCSYNQLTTLEGAPTKVGGSFNCPFNQLTTLEGAPKEVGGNFYCENNEKKFTKEDVLKVSNVKGEINV